MFEEDEEWEEEDEEWEEEEWQLSRENKTFYIFLLYVTITRFHVIFT